FLIYQMGASGGVITGSPLFTYGDKLLVGLISRSTEGFEDAYEIVGADTAFFYAAQVDGETYLIDHKGIMTRRTFAECGDAAFTNQAAGNPGLAKRILNELGKNDKAIAAELEAQGGISFVYSLNELEQRMG
ncbi:MAG: hypothetical protein II124_02860, partial [Clostridia bacterium]|nr:hypothetical protein [Clostridia bacterium]